MKLKQQEAEQLLGFFYSWGFIVSVKCKSVNEITNRITIQLIHRYSHFVQKVIFAQKKQI